MGENPGAPFRRLNIHDASSDDFQSLEKQFWKSLKFGSVQKFDGPVVCVDHVKSQYVVGTGNRLHLYKTRSDKLIRSFGRFKTNLRCCAFRGDGELLAAADDSGGVRVFNMSQLHMKASLRLFRGHKGPVTAVRFLSDPAKLASGSHDSTVRLWDLPTESCLSTFQLTAGDQVRALAVSNQSPSLLLAGSFDGRLRLFDLRRAPATRAAIVVEHGPPLSAAAISPCDSLLVGGGGRTVGVWALHGGDRHDRVAELTAHHKTVTGLAFAREGSRLLSAGLDGLVKVHHVGTYEELHHWEISSRIIAMSLAENDSSLVLGGDDGLLHTRRHRLPEEQDVAAAGLPTSKEQPLPSALLDRAVIAELEARTPMPMEPPSDASQRERREHRAKAFLQRARADRFSEPTGAVVHTAVFVAAQKYAKQEQHLIKFEHTKALLTVLRPAVRMQHPERTLAVIQELIRRRALKTAIAGQEAATGLSALFYFIRRFIWRPAYSATLQYAAQCVLEVYRNDDKSPLRSAPLNQHVAELEKVLADELQFISAAKVFQSLAESVTEEDEEEMDT